MSLAGLVEYDSSSESDSEVIPGEFVVAKPPKKERGPVKISIPSLSDFDDLDKEESSKKKNKLQPAKKLPGVLALLPPARGEAISTANFIPHVLTKKPPTKTSLTPTQIKMNAQKTIVQNRLNDTSNSDDEDSIDFFSLTEVENKDLSEPPKALDIPEEVKPDNTDTTLTSVMKDKELGPQLPVPSEYNLDSEGNVAIDDRAIEYLCGKRGVKRKEQFINEADIINISGEDIKPDEREWLVKALTEEPVQRPVSIGSGPSSQSKKKHQITYLAHQAKAMEIELKNQWAANRMARKQTQSKYGF